MNKQNKNIMTQEDKELLLRDLCARLPYGIKFLRESWNYETDQELSVIKVLEDIDKDGYINNTKVYKVEDIKPYLFPMSSMTDEQKVIYGDLCYSVIQSLANNMQSELNELINWLNAHHFDYRGLIEKSLALDATNLGIYE